jgi:hypothetical protein
MLTTHTCSHSPRPLVTPSTVVGPQVGGSGLLGSVLPASSIPPIPASVYPSGIGVAASSGGVGVRAATETALDDGSLVKAQYEVIRLNNIQAAKRAAATAAAEGDGPGAESAQAQLRELASHQRARELEAQVRRRGIILERTSFPQLVFFSFAPPP